MIYCWDGVRHRTKRAITDSGLYKSIIKFSLDEKRAKAGLKGLDWTRGCAEEGHRLGGGLDSRTPGTL